MKILLLAVTMFISATGTAADCSFKGSEDGATWAEFACEAILTDSDVTVRLPKPDDCNTTYTFACEDTFRNDVSLNFACQEKVDQGGAALSTYQSTMAECKLGGGSDTDLFLDRRFSSSYIAYNGRTYSAEIVLGQHGGTFQSSAGFLGNLKNLSTSNDGMTLEGQWNALNSGGWFKFHMENETSGKFSGTWGDSNGTQGNWWGQYQ
jgi:hypothetical protein